jgi:predicted RNase H-like nuclease (RuvC/YqgF family)
MASSSASQNNFDLNDVSNVQPEIWGPSFPSPRGHLMITDSVMLDDATAASVARGIITPRDGKLLVDRSDVEAINDSMAFIIQGATSVSNMAQCLQVRRNEIQSLQNQILVLQRLFMDFRRRNIVLQQENRELKKLLDSYANGLGKRYTKLEKNTNRLREQHENLLNEVQNLRVFRPKT